MTDGHAATVSTAPTGGWLPRSELVGPLPASTDVLIVGGGLAGASLAYYLAREGVEVVLVERGELNREASGTNAGSFHFQIAIHQLTGSETDNVRERLQTEVRLHAEAAEVWQTLEEELDGPLDLHITGGLMVAETEEELRLLHDKQRDRGGGGPRRCACSRARSCARSLRTSPTTSRRHVLSRRRAMPNPALATPLFALRAVAGRCGDPHARRGDRRSRWSPTSATGRFAVTTSAGRIHANRIVNAAGAWANDLAALTGLRLPLWSDGLHLNVTEPREHVLGPMVQHIGRRLTLKQTTNNTFIIGGGWPARAEPRPRRYSTRWESMAGNVAVAVRVVPLLADVRIVRTWSGVMAFTNDLAPIVGESPRLPGYHTLMATTGFTLGPLMARLLAETMATGRNVDSRCIRRRPRGRGIQNRPEEAEMNRDDVDWRGYWPACPTPFTQRRRASTSSRSARSSSGTSARGCTAIFINGTTGEWFSQTPDERRLVAETVIEQVAGRVTVVIGCTSLTASDAVELGRHALAAGADGIGSTPPPYSKTYPDETVRVLPGHLGRRRRAGRWSTTGRTGRASTSAPISPSGSRPSTTSSRSRTARRTSSSSSRRRSASSGACGSSARS